jgi:hypothetical protein
MEYNELLKKTEELRKYAQLEGTEVGEACYVLFSATNLRDYFSKEFSEAVVKEIMIMLQNFKENYVILDREEKITNKYKELIHKDDL